MGHLTYVGDATLGKDINVGCGVVFVNYDGKNKHQTVVGDHAFIGSATNIVAPVTIGDHAVTLCWFNHHRRCPFRRFGDCPGTSSE